VSGEAAQLVFNGKAFNIKLKTSSGALKLGKIGSGEFLTF
jgi:hypothetical protein